MHIAFQVLPITEIILRGNFASESIAGLEESVRAQMKSLKPMATHIDRFWGHFRDDTLGVFYSHLSACVSSVVSLASKLSWSHGVVPHELEEYILDEHFIKMSNSERKVSTKRDQAPLNFCWGIYTSASAKCSSEYTAVQTDQVQFGKLTSMMDLLGNLAVCNDEVQEMRRDKSIFDYLKSERKA